MGTQPIHMIFTILWLISLCYFSLSMLPFTFLWSDMPLLLMASQTCTLTGDLTVVWIHLAWYFSDCLRRTQQWRRLLWLWNTVSCECVVFLQKRYIFIHDIAPCHNSKRARTFLECYGIRVLKWPRNSPEMNSIENILNIMKKEIGNQSRV